MTEGRKDRTTEGQGESSIAPLFQSGAIITIYIDFAWDRGRQTHGAKLFSQA